MFYPPNYVIQMLNGEFKLLKLQELNIFSHKELINFVAPRFMVDHLN